MSNSTCVLCHLDIQWREGQGWLTINEDGFVRPGTGNCESRSDPELGHRITPEADYFATPADASPEWLDGYRAGVQAVQQYLKREEGNVWSGYAKTDFPTAFHPPKRTP